MKSSLFDSSTEKRTFLRQVLAVFFPSYCNPEIDRNCLFFEEGVIYTVKGIAEAGIPDRYSMISQISKYFLFDYGNWFILRTLMTMDIKKSEKRNYVASETEDAEVEETERKTNHEYHRSVAVFLDKFVSVAYTRMEDSSFLKEVVSVLSFVDGDLMNRLQRSQFNSILLKMYNDIPNQTLKRQIKSRNKVLCTVDPALEKI